MAILNNVSVNIHRQVCVDVCLLLPWCICRRKPLLAYMIIPCLTFWGIIRLFSEWFRCFIMSPQYTRIPVSLQLCQGFFFFFFFYCFLFCFFFYSHPSGREVVSHVVFICISSMTNDVEHLFMCFLVMCISSLETCVFKSFARF